MMYLVIGEFEEVKGDVMELDVDRADERFDGAFHGLDAGPERARLLLGEVVDDRRQHNCSRRRRMDEEEELQPLFLIQLHAMMQTFHRRANDNIHEQPNQSKP